MKIISKNLSDLEVGVVVLTGGEPMTRKDIFDVVKFYSDENIDIRVQTNGSMLTKEAVLKFNDANLSGITISLDSLYEDKMNNIIRAKNFKKIIQGIVNVKKYGKFEAVCLNTVVNKQNIAEIPDIIKFASELNIFVSLIPLHIGNNGLFSKETSKDDNNSIKSEEDLKIFNDTMNSLIKMKKQGYLILNPLDHLKGIYNFMTTGIHSWKCDSPYLYFSVAPDGTFCPCLEYKTDYKVNSSDFAQTYKSSKFNKSVREIVNSCEGCYYLCWLEVSSFIKNPLRLMKRALELYKVKKGDKIDYDKVIKKYIKFNS
jgi:MoaA/NifB/PqqE/SkfB family radical SAM enzyme